MKYILLLIVLNFSACKSKDTDLMTKLSKTGSQIQTLDCPQGITCNVEVLKNKNYTIDKDSMGRFYPNITNGENMIVKYTYSVDNPDNLPDGNQSETIHFIINKEMKSSLKDGELQDVKMLFGKNCFCKDIFGFYKVEKGTLIIKGSDIKLEFTIPKLGDRQFVKKVHLTI